MEAIISAGIFLKGHSMCDGHIPPIECAGVSSAVHFWCFLIPALLTHEVAYQFTFSLFGTCSPSLSALMVVGTTAT